MSIKLKGSTDGSVTLQAPADTSPSGSDKTLTLPTTTGSANQFVKNGGTAGELEYSSMVETSTGDVQARRARSNTAGDVALSVQPSDSSIHYGLRIDAANNSLNLDRASGTAANLLTIDSSGFITQKFTSNNSSTPEGLFINNQNNATGNNASLIFSNDSGNRKKIAIAAVDVGNYGASDLVFALDGADSGSVSLSSDEKMRIDSSGNVVIGRSSALSKLHVSSSNGNADARIGGDAASLGLVLSYDQANATVSRITANPTYTSTNARLHICVDGDANADQLVLTGAGRVGIGTSSPGNPLHIADQNPSIRLQSNSGSYQGRNTLGQYNNILYLECDNDNAVSNSTIAFTVDAQEKMRITNTGTINQTTNSSDSDRYNNTSNNVFHSDIDSNVVLLIENSSASPYGMLIDFSDAAPDNNSNYFFEGQDSSTVRVKIWSDGDLDNHDNSYGGLSDQKLKQDIIDAGSQWDDLKDLRVRKFKFKSDVAAHGDEAKTLIGLVAQEAETVCPGLVKNNPDLDEEGNDLGTTTKSVRYSVLYMKAIKALQEAQTRIETLETQHADLLARVTALEAAE